MDQAATKLSVWGQQGAQFVAGLKKEIDRIMPQSRKATGALLDHAKKKPAVWDQIAPARTSQAAKLRTQGAKFIAGLKKAIDRVMPQVLTATEAFLDRVESRVSVWVERVLSPDPRRSPRFANPPLAAYYWTGGAPEPRKIANISGSGLYLLTNERWYPGTCVTMTLQTFGPGREMRKEWIAVEVQIVRSGVDGVGGAFLFPSAGIEGYVSSERCADRRTVERFIKRLMANATP